MKKPKEVAPPADHGDKAKHSKPTRPAEAPEAEVIRKGKKKKVSVVRSQHLIIKCLLVSKCVQKSVRKDNV